MTSQILRTQTIARAGSLAALLFAAACAGGPTDATTTDTDTLPSRLEAGMNTNGIEGNLRLFLTDAPADYEAVWVTTSRVEVSTSATDGTEATWATLSDQPQTDDLLALRDDVTSILGDAELAPGSYQQLRMIVDSARVVADGEERPLTIPSGAQTGVKINLDLTIEPDTVYALVLDFDAAESIHETGNGELIMRPTIKVEYVGEVAPDGDLTQTDGEEQVPVDEPEAPEETDEPEVEVE
jgi:hypothetical protein